MVLAPFDIDSPLYNSKKICSGYKVHGTQNDQLELNAKIGFKKYGKGPKILAKTSQNMKVWFCELYFGTFWLISWDLVHVFQNRFLRWNRELKPFVSRFEYTEPTEIHVFVPSTEPFLSNISEPRNGFNFAYITVGPIINKLVQHL